MIHRSCCVIFTLQRSQTYFCSQTFHVYFVYNTSLGIRYKLPKCSISIYLCISYDHKPILIKDKNKSRQYYNISLIYQYYDIKWLHRILVLMLYETDEKIEKHIDVAIFHNISNEIYIIYDIGIEHWCSICLKIWDFFFSSIFIWGRSFNDPTTSIRLCNKCNTGKHSNAMLLFLVSMDIGICTLRILVRYDAIV